MAERFIYKTKDETCKTPQQTNGHGFKKNHCQFLNLCQKSNRQYFNQFLEMNTNER